MSGWEKVSGGWPSEAPPDYRLRTSLGTVRVWKTHAGRFVVELGERSRELPRKATFDHAEAVVCEWLVEEYVGEKPLKVATVADPEVDHVFAIRATFGNAVVDFLRHADGELEECEFSSWPPRRRTW